MLGDVLAVLDSNVDSYSDSYSDNYVDSYSDTALQYKQRLGILEHYL